MTDSSGNEIDVDPADHLPTMDLSMLNPDDVVRVTTDGQSAQWTVVEHGAHRVRLRRVD